MSSGEPTYSVFGSIINYLNVRTYIAASAVISGIDAEDKTPEDVGKDTAFSMC